MREHADLKRECEHDFHLIRARYAVNRVEGLAGPACVTHFRDRTDTEVIDELSADAHSKYKRVLLLWQLMALFVTVSLRRYDIELCAHRSRLPKHRPAFQEPAGTTFMTWLGVVPRKDG